MLMVARSTSGESHDFNAFNLDGEVWSVDADDFVTWANGDYLDYRIAATELGTSGEFRATAPSGAVRYVLRYRGASLAASFPRFEGDVVDADGYDLPGSLRLLLAPLAGKLSGAGTTTNIIRAADDSKARITATVDASGNRTAITLDATP